MNWAKAAYTLGRPIFGCPATFFKLAAFPVATQAVPDLEDCVALASTELGEQSCHAIIEVVESGAGFAQLASDRCQLSTQECSEVVGRQRCFFGRTHDRATVWPDLHKTFGRQYANGFADGVRCGAELRCEVPI